ncbi:MAG: hypothetical protein V4719_14865 [Planctomycetota bacterium]
MSIRSCLMAASLCLVAGIAMAQGPQFPAPSFRGPAFSGPENYQDVTPIPGVGVSPFPEPATGGAVVVPAPGGTSIIPELDGAPVPVGNCGCEFYDRVCYKDKRKIAPCAETLVVSVLDPCSRKCDCETKCVQVKICAPPCGCAKVKVSRTGRHTRYDFGKYAIDIYSNRNGTIVVDYDA